MRLRQVVLAAPALRPVAERIQRHFDLPDPFADPGVAEFGLVNAVFEVGDTFLEVVSPSSPGAAARTAAGRYLAKRGNPEAAGYMAIFQTDDIAAARARATANNARIVWQADLPDIAGTHLHPADVPGAIVSIDWADPPESWHWAGPRWRGGAPADGKPGRGVTGFTLATADPAATEARWREVLGTEPPGVTFTPRNRTLNADMPVRHVSVQSSEHDRPGPDGIVEIRLDIPTQPSALTLGTVRLTA